MKQLENIMFVFILSLICAQAMAQEEKTRKWDISITLGQAAPIGSYSKITPEESLESKYTGFHFYKEGHAAAKAGGFRSIEVSYLLNKNWVASINCQSVAKFSKYRANQRVPKFGNSPRLLRSYA